jgi:hypothetical protein
VQHPWIAYLAVIIVSACVGYSYGYRDGWKYGAIHGKNYPDTTIKDVLNDR